METCEVKVMLLGIDLGVCGEPAAGRFIGACVHEHVRERLMCQFHADRPEAGLCRDCFEMPGPDAHECAVTITPVAEAHQAVSGG